MRPNTAYYMHICNLKQLCSLFFFLKEHHIPSHHSPHSPLITPPLPTTVGRPTHASHHRTPHHTTIKNTRIIKSCVASCLLLWLWLLSVTWRVEKCFFCFRLLGKVNGEDVVETALIMCSIYLDVYDLATMRRKTISVVPCDVFSRAFFSQFISCFVNSYSVFFMTKGLQYPSRLKLIHNKEWEWYRNGVAKTVICQCHGRARASKNSCINAPA